MAAFYTTRPVTVLSTGRITNFIAHFVGTIVAWNDTRVTRNTLSKLTSRELEDIGLCRADIHAASIRNV